MKFLIPFLLLISTAARAESVTLTPDNTVVYRQVVDGQSTTLNQLKLTALVLKRSGADYPIYLVMDCPGGDIYAGEQFIQFAKTLQNVKTLTIFAASMCAGIVEGLPGERLVTENGILMFHRAKGSFEGQFEDGEIEQQLALWKGIVRSMEQRNADRMCLSLDTYKHKVKDEMWLYGADNVTQKAADKTVDILCSADLIAAKETSRVETAFGSANLIFSGCPLLRYPIGVEEEKE